MKRIAKVLDIDGKFRENPDFPVAVVKEPWESEDGKQGHGMIVDPIFNSSVTRNLYGRMMTLLEATCETHKLSAVKDLFGKELREWETYVYESARDLAKAAGVSDKNADGAVNVNLSNVYTR